MVNIDFSMFFHYINDFLYNFIAHVISLKILEQLDSCYKKDSTLEEQ